MGLLFLLSYVAISLQITFAVVAVGKCESKSPSGRDVRALDRISFNTPCFPAAALYYLAELVEEYTVVAKKVIYLMILATATVYVGLMLFDNLPWSLILPGLASQGLHAMILKRFPFVNVTSPAFILTVILVIINHFMAFRFFAQTYYPLSEVLAYFTLCLWVVPFALFVSLSANDQVLPTTFTNEQTPLLGEDLILRDNSGRAN